MPAPCKPRKPLLFAAVVASMLAGHAHGTAAAKPLVKDCPSTSHKCSTAEACSCTVSGSEKVRHHHGETTCYSCAQVSNQGTSQLLPPAPPYYPFPEKNPY